MCFVLWFDFMRSTRSLLLFLFIPDSVCFGDSRYSCYWIARNYPLNDCFLDCLTVSEPSCPVIPKTDNQHFFPSKNGGLTNVQPLDVLMYLNVFNLLHSDVKKKKKMMMMMMMMMMMWGRFSWDIFRNGLEMFGDVSSWRNLRPRALAFLLAAALQLLVWPPPRPPAPAVAAAATWRGSATSCPCSVRHDLWDSANLMGQIPVSLVERSDKIDNIDVN